jgi:chorismate synthase
MSIPSVKGVEIGLGFRGASCSGSHFHDEIHHDGHRFTRPTNRAGGIEGGVSNGPDIMVRMAIKPLPSLTKPLQSVDISTKEPFEALKERADVCVVPAAGVIGEAVVAIELAVAFGEKFGGDSLEEMKRNCKGYLKQIEEYSAP